MRRLFAVSCIGDDDAGSSCGLAARGSDRRVEEASLEQRTHGVDESWLLFVALLVVAGSHC